MRKGLSAVIVIALLLLTPLSSAFPIKNSAAPKAVPYPVPPAPSSAQSIKVDYIDYDVNSTLIVVTWGIPQGYSKAKYYMYFSYTGLETNKVQYIGEGNASVPYVVTVVNLANYNYFKLVMVVDGGKRIESPWVNPYNLPPGALSIPVPRLESECNGIVNPEFPEISWDDVKKAAKFIIENAPITGDIYMVYEAGVTCYKHGFTSRECIIEGGTTAVLLLIPVGGTAVKDVGKTVGKRVAERFGITILKKEGAEEAARSLPRVAILSGKLTEKLKNIGLVKSASVRINFLELKKNVNIVPGGYCSVFDDVTKNSKEAVDALEDLKELGISLETIEKDVEKGLTSKAVDDEVHELLKKGLSKETIAKETQRGLAVSEIKKNVDYLLNLGIHSGIIENEVKRGISTSEIVENINYLLDRGMSRESIGRIIEKETGRGLTTRVIKKYAENLVEIGITEENVGRVIEEAEKHGTNLGSLVQGVDMFLGSFERSTISIPGKGYEIVLERGNEHYGLVHAYLRHVREYNMEGSGITTFWPMGQKIIVNEQEKKLPTVINNPEQLARLLKKTIQEMKENSEKYFINQKTGNLKKSFDIKIPLSGEISREMNLPEKSIEEVRVMFSYKQLTDPGTGRKVNVYTLKSFFPVKGEAVYEYRSWSKEWVQKR